MFYTLADFNLNSITAEKLGEVLIEAKKAYYTSGKPLMDDSTYDTLEDHLKKIHPHHRIFKKVGTNNFDTGFVKTPHVFPMTSQNKVKTKKDLEKYFNRHQLHINKYLVEPKLDGLSLELVYQDGKFKTAITRGDGHIGDDISQNVIKMKNFIPVISNFSGSIRAEIIVTYQDFSTLDQSKYTNPRNAASGIAQRLDGRQSNLCTLIYHDLVDSFGKTFAKEQDKIDFLNQHGLTSVATHSATNFQEIEEIFNNYSIHLRQKLDFDIDGLVIKIDDLKIADSLGEENGRPKGQVAYKFPARSSQSKILNVLWQVGPLGSITPVAEIEPVELSGALISFASLANYDLIKSKNINIGDYVEISRRGDVIPLIEKVVSKMSIGHLTAPLVCPSCQSRLITDKKFIKCINQDCQGQLLGRLRLYCQFLDIQNISNKTIEKLFYLNKLRYPSDFYRLITNDIATIDGLGEKSANNILKEIKKKQNLTLVELFTAVAIPNFSQKRIQQLISAGHNTPQKLFEISKQDLLSQPGIQSSLAEKILTGLKQRKQVIIDLLKVVTIKQTNIKNTLNGAIICITGILSQPRKTIENLIVSSGGKVANTVSRNTTFLLTNDQTSTSSKLEQAHRFETKIISEEELLQLLN